MQSSIANVILEGFGLGLASGPYCLGACLPILGPYMLIQSYETNGVSLLARFLLGRLAGYLAVGIFAGWLGLGLAAISTNQVKALAPLATIISGALVLVYGLTYNNRRSRFCQIVTDKLKLTHKFPLLAGFIIGINICPPFVAGIAEAAQTGHPLNGMLLFAFFFIGSSLYLIPLAFMSLVSRYERVKTVGQLVSILCGLWLILTGLARLMR